MNWCFAIINNKLAEIFFEKNKERIKFLGHAYVKEEDYDSIKEKKWIREDTIKTKFTYRKGKYIRKSN